MKTKLDEKLTFYEKLVDKIGAIGFVDKSTFTLADNIKTLLLEELPKDEMHYDFGKPIWEKGWNAYREELIKLWDLK